MKKVMKSAACVLAFGVLGVAGPVATAEPSADGSVRTANLEVRERLMTLERIHVTAEKPVDPDLDATAPELLRLLDEIERVEQGDPDPLSD